MQARKLKDLVKSGRLSVTVLWLIGMWGRMVSCRRLKIGSNSRFDNRRQVTNLPYSYRSATIGSTLLARRAGSRLAIIVTNASRAVAMAMVAGSRAVNP
jgi:hypothetical protein